MAWLHTTMEVVMLANGIITVPLGIYRLCQIEKRLREIKRLS